LAQGHMKRRMEQEDGVFPKQPRLGFTHAFKFLAPDVLSSAILGVKGQGIQDLQTSTETRISIADRTDKYSNTNSRLVLVRAHTPTAINSALHHVFEKLKSLLDSPKRAEFDMSELILKQGGVDARFRCVVPKATAGAVIGPKGANVAELRGSTGCRVRVEDGKVGTGDTSEQLVSLLGTVDSLCACACKINMMVQDQSDQGWFSDWAHLSLNSKLSAVHQPVTNFYAAAPPIQPTTTFGFPNNPSAFPDEEMLFRVSRAMPRSLVEQRTFAMQASLPIEAMSGLIGKGGSGTKEIYAQTGAKITLKDDDPNTTVTLEGSMYSVVSAYMLMMKRYLELEVQTSAKEAKSKGKGGKGAH